MWEFLIDLKNGIGKSQFSLKLCTEGLTSAIGRFIELLLRSILTTKLPITEWLTYGNKILKKW